MVHILRKASTGATAWKTLLSKSCWVTTSLPLSPLCAQGLYRKKRGKKSSTTIITINNIHNVQRDGRERQKTGTQLNQTGKKLVGWSGSEWVVAYPDTTTKWRTAGVCPETCPLQHLYQWPRGGDGVRCLLLAKASCSSWEVWTGAQPGDQVKGLSPSA